MSLCCDETGVSITYGARFYQGTRNDVPFYSALSSEVINKIPLDKRRKTKCRRGDRGVDIHEGVGGSPNGLGNFSSFSMRLGKFLFSISAETAAEFLPTHYRNYEQQNTTTAAPKNTKRSKSKQHAAYSHFGN